MKIVINNLYLILLTGLILLSCSGSSETNERRNIDSLIIDIPGWLKSDTFEQRRLAKINRLLKLDELGYGFDGIKFRIWLDCSYQSLQKLIVIEKVDQKWDALFYTYELLADGKEGEGDFEIKLIEIIHKIPKTGWSNFDRTFSEFGLRSLLDYSEFDSIYHLPMGGDGISIEVSSPELYRYYRYPAFKRNTHIHNGPLKLERALQLIEREFDFERPCHD